MKVSKKMIESVQCLHWWKSVKIAVECLENIDLASKEVIYTGADDGYNLCCKAEFNGGDWVIDGGCGYGSRIEAFLSKDGNTLDIRIQSCGGHWVAANLSALETNHPVLNISADGKPSEMSWADNKTGIERAAEIKEAIIRRIK